MTEFDFDIDYIKGSQNVRADALSRISIEDFQNTCKACYTKVYRVTTRRQAKQQKAAQKQVFQNIDTEIKKRNVYESRTMGKIPQMKLKDNEIIIAKKKMKKKDEKIVCNVEKYSNSEGLLVKVLLSDLEKVSEKY